MKKDTRKSPPMEPAFRRELVDRVADHPRLTPPEKETTMSFARSDNLSQIYTSESGITRRLLQHEHFQVEEVEVLTGARSFGTRILTEYDDEQITGVHGYIPIGTIKIGTRVRQDPSHCHVIATPDKFINE